MKAEEIINDLIERTKSVLNNAEKLNAFNEEQLNQKPSPESWSALEAIKHLNCYGEFYIPEIQKRIQDSNRKKSDVFKTGVLGNYFAKSVAPKEKLNKMKAFKSMNFAGSQLNKEVLSDFINQQQQILSLLNDARQSDLTRVKTSISISKIIKLRLGDTFKVVIFHNQRHMNQALKAAES